MVRRHGKLFTRSWSDRITIIIICLYLNSGEHRWIVISDRWVNYSVLRRQHISETNRLSEWRGPLSKWRGYWRESVCGASNGPSARAVLSGLSGLPGWAACLAAACACRPVLRCSGLRASESQPPALASSQPASLPTASCAFPILDTT